MSAQLSAALVLTVFIITSCCVANESTGDVPFDADEVISFLQHSVDCHSNPALAVGVLKDGKVLLSRGFGVADVDTKAAVTGDTLFGIASVTKSFTATLLVKLLHEKTTLTVNSKVRELLGDKFRMPDEWRTQETTFADLLSHRTGMFSNNKIRYDNNLTRENLLDRLPLLTSPEQFRVDFTYSNLMYGVSTRLSEVIGGTAWEDLVTEHLFKPLGMSRSTFSTRLDRARADNLATPYNEMDGPGLFETVSPQVSKQWAMLCGSGCIVSTVNDMLKWVSFHLNGGKNEQGEQVMAPEAFAQLHKSRFLIKPLPGRLLRSPPFPVASSEYIYAFGLRKGFYRGYDMIAHSGSTFGYKALMTMLPKQNIGIVTLFSGRDDRFRHRFPVNMYLMDTALGIEPWLNRSTACSYPEPWEEKRPLSFRPKLSADVSPRLDFKLYEGTYHNDAYGYLDIAYNDSLHSLVLTYGFGSWQLLLWPNAKDDEDEGDTRERFYGKGLPPVSPVDLKPFYFVTYPSDADVIAGVNATPFEKHLPPVFCRPDQREECTEAIFESQTYNVGKCQVKGCDVSGNGSGTQYSVWYRDSVLIFVAALFAVLCVRKDAFVVSLI